MRRAKVPLDVCFQILRLRAPWICKDYTAERCRAYDKGIKALEAYFRQCVSEGYPEDIPSLFRGIGLAPGAVKAVMAGFFNQDEGEGGFPVKHDVRAAVDAGLDEGMTEKAIADRFNLSETDRKWAVRRMAQRRRLEAIDEALRTKRREAIKTEWARTHA